MDTGDAELTDVSAWTTAHGAAVLHANGRRVTGKLLQLLGSGEEFLVGGGGIREGSLKLSTLNGVLGDEGDALFVALDGRCLGHGGK